MPSTKYAFARLLPSSDKVVTCAFHPDLPLLATFDRRNYVTVWEYERAEPVFECHFGPESLYNKDTLDAICRAEANPDHFGNNLYPYMLTHYLQPANYGKVRALEFLDLDTVCWTIAMQRVITHGVSAEVPDMTRVRGLADRRRLLITCDKAVLLFDLITKQVETISCSHTNMGGKFFRNAKILPRDVHGEPGPSPSLAIGSADGTVRILSDFSPEKFTLFGTKAGEAITAMAVVPIHNRDALFVGDEVGGLHIIDPYKTRAGMQLGKDGAYPPVAVLPMHKQAVLDIVFAPGPDPSTPKPRVVSVSECGRIGIWDIACERGWGLVTLLAKIKCRDFKLTGACSTFTGVYQPGEPGVLLATSTPKVYGLALDKNVTIPVMDLSPNLPVRENKKCAKLYSICAPILSPYTIGVASNAGIAILEAQGNPTLSICALPAAQTFSEEEQSNSDDLLGISAPATQESLQDMMSLSVMFVTPHSLVGATFQAGEAPQAASGLDIPDADKEGHQRDGHGYSMARPLPVTQITRHNVAELGQQGVPPPFRVTSNSRGTMLAIASYLRQEYLICGQSTTKGPAVWAPRERGIGGTVVWHDKEDYAAIHVVPKTKAPVVPQRRFRASKSEVSQLSSSLLQSNETESFVTIRMMHNVSLPGESAGITIIDRVPLPSKSSVTNVHGGMLLGVGFTEHGEKASKLRFYDWSGRPTGIPDMPDPHFVSFANSNELVALAYDDAVAVYAFGTTLRLLTRIAVDGINGLAWNDTILFTSNQYTVVAHFIVPPAARSQQLTHATTLFTHTSSTSLPELTGLPSAANYEVQSIEISTSRVAHGRALAVAGEMSTELPLLTPQPGLLWKLVKASNEVAWLASSMGHAYAVSLRHAGLRCRSMALQGELKGARKLATSSLQHQYHDNLARFMCTLGADGAAEALLLPGLTLELELELAIKCGALTRGVACLAALLAGCSTKALLNKYPAWVARDINPDVVEEEEIAADDPFADLNKVNGAEAAQPKLNMADEVVAIFRQAAGVQAPAVLARLAATGVQGRATPLDKDLFSSAPDGDGPSKPPPPPPSTKYKPLFPRADPAPPPDTAAAKDATAQLIDIDPDGAQTDTFVDIIDWDWPLQKLGTAAAADTAPAHGQTAEITPEVSASMPVAGGADAAGGAAGPNEVQPHSTQPETVGGVQHVVTPMTLELGLRLLDATVMFADSSTLQATIQLMAPHTGVMTQSQQARLVAAIGAAGLAVQLSDLTLSGTTPILPSAAMLAGFLAGDARVTANVLEKQSFIPLKALFMQSCGAGGVEASVQWESELMMRMGGPTRKLTILPQTT